MERLTLTSKVTGISPGPCCAEPCHLPWWRLCFSGLSDDPELIGVADRKKLPNPSGSSGYRGCQGWIHAAAVSPLR